MRLRQRKHYEKNKADIYRKHRVYVANHNEARKEYLKKYWQDPKNQQRRRDLYRLRIEHYKKRDRDHYYKTRDRHRELQMAKRYKISVEYYRGLFKSQNSLCAICGEPETIKNKILSVDHCHKTGKVRGLLCGHCNRALGYLREDVSLLPKIQKYLENHA